MQNEELVKTEEQVSTQRVITIVASRGEKIKIPFGGTVWSELKTLLEKGGTDVEGNRFSPYSLSSMKCVESSNRTTLEHPNAVVPEGNFNLFLMPYKSKSGGMSRSEINAAIKKHIEKDGDKAKQFFSYNGKNYTMVASSILLEKLESYAPGTKKKAATAKAEATANVADVVASVKNHKEENLFEELQGLTTDEKLDIVIKLLVDLKNGVTSNVAVETKAVETKAVETEEEKAARLQKEEEAKKAEEERKAKLAEEERKRKEKAEEDARLDAEMNEMMGGFTDVARR